MDLYAEITDRIIEQMEQGVIPWVKPWRASGKAVSRTTGKPYSLLNQMLLARPGEYLTFKEYDVDKYHCNELSKPCKGEIPEKIKHNNRNHAKESVIYKAKS